MYAVVVAVKITDRESAEHFLHDVVVPRVSHAPGFVAGYWVAVEGGGRSMLIFSSEEAARESASRLPAALQDAPVTLESVEVGEVVAHAGQATATTGT